MSDSQRQLQSAYEKKHYDRAELSVDRVYDAMYAYLRRDLGLPETVARARAQSEIDGRAAGLFCETWEEQNVTISGRSVLDLGAGLGGVAVEVVKRGGHVTAIEPGRGWREIAQERLAQTGRGVVLGALGEALPFADDCFDLVMSRQVLEHVDNPEQVIREAYRVLKPGGYFCFSYENYLSFFEPHYQVRWLPLLPKKIGAVYLRRLHRDPRFLLESIHYTTFPAVRRYLREAGFVCTRVDEYRRSLKCPKKQSLKWRMCKGIASLHEGLAIQLLATQDSAKRMFKTATYEFVRKPG
jgi:SAM-dependent methyltransferase